MSARIHRGQKRAWDSPGARVINCPMWVLGIKLPTRAARAAEALTVPWVISLAPKRCLVMNFVICLSSIWSFQPKTSRKLSLRYRALIFLVLGLSSRMHLALTAHLHLDQWGYHTEQHSSWLSRVIKHNDRPCSNCTLHKCTVENHFRRTQGLFNRDWILNDSWGLLFVMLGVIIVLQTYKNTFLHLMRHTGISRGKVPHCHLINFWKFVSLPRAKHS